MRIVIDTNVVISGTFFGGAPRVLRQVRRSTVSGQLSRLAKHNYASDYAEYTKWSVV